MHVLVVLDHPDPSSFCAAVAERFVAGAEEAGHTFELADLHAEGFDPRWTIADKRGSDGLGAPQDVRTEQARIERAPSGGKIEVAVPAWNVNLVQEKH